MTERYFEYEGDVTVPVLSVVLQFLASYVAGACAMSLVPRWVPLSEEKEENVLRVRGLPACIARWL